MFEDMNNLKKRDIIFVLFCLAILANTWLVRAERANYEARQINQCKANAVKAMKVN